MASVIVLINFTDQGIRNVKQTTERAKVATAEAEKLGIKIKDIYWTLGQYDALLIAEAPDAESIMAWALGIGSLGNIRTQTMRAFSAEEMSRVLPRIP